jgi:hypothetical protein
MAAGVSVVAAGVSVVAAGVSVVAAGVSVVTAGVSVVTAARAGGAGRRIGFADALVRVAAGTLRARAAAHTADRIEAASATAAIRDARRLALPGVGVTRLSSRTNAAADAAHGIEAAISPGAIRSTLASIDESPRALRAIFVDSAFGRISTSGSAAAETEGGEKQGLYENSLERHQ